MASKIESVSIAPELLEWTRSLFGAGVFLAPAKEDSAKDMMTSISEESVRQKPVRRVRV